MALNAASFLLNGHPIINEFWLMLTICMMNWAALAHFVYYVLEDFKRILGVKMFSIKHKQDNPAVPSTSPPSGTRRNSSDSNDS